MRAKHLAFSYKKQIQELVEDNVFVKGTQKNKPEKMMSTLTQEETVELYQDTFVD